MSTDNYSMNSYLLRNCIIPSEATIKAQESVACGLMVPQALAVAKWKIMQFAMGTGSCFYPLARENEFHWVSGNRTIPNTPFFTHFNTGRCIRSHIPPGVTYL